jgi:aminopeptidase N
MFDAVSYNKGGTILHMLRSYIGDDAFKAGMNKYLNDNKFGTGEAHQLRLAFEKVSGKDLNWFFNQWYFNNGHPKLDVKYVYSEDAKIVTVQIEQTQQGLFEFPLAIEVFEGDSPKRYEVWVDEKSTSFSFKYENKPKLVNVDADRVLLAEINDEKSLENLVHLYKVGKKYEDRREAIEGLTGQQTNEMAFKTLEAALKDDYYGLRIMALENIDLVNNDEKKAVKTIENMAVNDEKTLVKAKAIDKLAEYQGDAYIDLYKSSLASASSAVRISALNALFWEDKEAALQYAKSIENELEKKSLKEALIPIYIMDKTESEQSFVAGNLIEGMFFNPDRESANLYKDGFQWTAYSSNEETTQNLVDSLVNLGEQFNVYGASKLAKQVLQQILAVKTESDYDNKEALVKIVEGGISRLE